MCYLHVTVTCYTGVGGYLWRHMLHWGKGVAIVTVSGCYLLHGAQDLILAVEIFNRFKLPVTFRVLLYKSNIYKDKLDILGEIVKRNVTRCYKLPLRKRGIYVLSCYILLLHWGVPTDTFLYKTHKPSTV